MILQVGPIFILGGARLVFVGLGGGWLDEGMVGETKLKPLTEMEQARVTVLHKHIT